MREKIEMRTNSTFMWFIIMALTGAAQAEPHKELSIPLDWAIAAATVASETCKEMGFDTTVTVVDQRAQPRVQLMREGAFPHTVETSRRKAITAASRRVATAAIEAENEHETTLGDVFNEIGLITLSGGVPILYSGVVIGGIGIAGSPGEDENGKEFDDICAEAGIAAIAERLN
ncbi:MAG: heme-binding protein [Pseudomonadota bacterium]